MIVWTAYDETTGLPAPSLPISPGGMEFIAYVTRAGIARTRPSILNLGGGQYGFAPRPGDRETGVAYVIALGPGSRDARISGSVHAANNPFSAWALEDEATGALWAGPPSTLTSFRGLQPPPPVVAPLPYLMTVSPSAAALAAGLCSFVASSPFGAAPAFVSDVVEIVAIAGSLAPVPSPASPGAEPYLDDLSDVIELLASGSYIVTRRSPTQTLNGRRVEPLTSSFSIVASAQPASGREIERLPEGLRSSETMSVWTKAELRQARPEAGVEGDRLTIDGAVFEVQNVQRWNRLGNFYRATVTRVLE